jgi:hypothetical protein
LISVFCTSIDETGIDETGNFAFHPRFDKADEFVDGIARVQFGQYIARNPCTGEYCAQYFTWDAEMGYIDRLASLSESGQSKA